ncbi:conserved hypothetical protein [Culex quinquefasciatus]|uniref:Phorbol-ester/DAG-type domain-containing protein n=1 Tax=Culex quinquefasciatus TaxID=7176 RepID=B0XH85_CULQU|nr:conserved hypothetical protein [Culex quinquefasciatus]|eukprot:XP_001869007.1 conserved hypothetical protein [Culex quinquefasciatus]
MVIGHTRQGLRCRICKVNVHADCATQLPKCQVKQKLLRRQKSTSEIESRTELEEEKPTDIDQIYQVLKKAGEISSGKVSAVESRVQVNSTSTSDANAVENVRLVTGEGDAIDVRFCGSACGVDLRSGVQVGVGFVASLGRAAVELDVCASCVPDQLHVEGRPARVLQNFVDALSMWNLSLSL